MWREEVGVVLLCHTVLQQVQVHQQGKEVTLFGEKALTSNLETYHFRSNTLLIMCRHRKLRKHRLRLRLHHTIHILLNHQSRTN
jgi:hypothetical protein